jgi:hypothetical protein
MGFTRALRRENSGYSVCQVADGLTKRLGGVDHDKFVKMIGLLSTGQCVALIFSFSLSVCRETVGKEGVEQILWKLVPAI